MYRSTQKQPRPGRGRPRTFDREAALRAALLVFWRKGYAGASLTDLTRAMRINSPSLYAAFGSKERLFRHALELYAATETLDWDAVANAPTARRAVELFLEGAAIRFTRPNRPPGCLVILSVLFADDRSAAVGRELRRRRERITSRLGARIARAVREGELPSSVDAEAIATFYCAVEEGMAIQARDGATRETLLGVARYGLAAWDGLMGRGTGKRGTGKQGTGKQGTGKQGTGRPRR